MCWTRRFKDTTFCIIRLVLLTSTLTWWVLQTKVKLEYGIIKILVKIILIMKKELFNQQESMSPTNMTQITYLWNKFKWCETSLTLFKTDVRRASSLQISEKHWGKISDLLKHEKRSEKNYQNLKEFLSIESIFLKIWSNQRSREMDKINWAKQITLMVRQFLSTKHIQSFKQTQMKSTGHNI